MGGWLGGQTLGSGGLCSKPKAYDGSFGVATDVGLVYCFLLCGWVAFLAAFTRYEPAYCRHLFCGD